MDRVPLHKVQDVHMPLTKLSHVLNLRTSSLRQLFSLDSLHSSIHSSS